MLTTMTIGLIDHEGMVTLDFDRTNLRKTLMERYELARGNYPELYAIINVTDLSITADIEYDNLYFVSDGVTWNIAIEYRNRHSWIQSETREMGNLRNEKTFST